MSSAVSRETIGKVAAEAIPRYALVSITGATDKVSLVDDATTRPFGIAAFGADADADVTIVKGGRITKALVDGSGTAILPGDRLMGATGGLLVKYVATEGNLAVAEAQEGSTGDGDVISVFLFSEFIPEPAA